MASFFNVGSNPFSTAVGQRIEQATDGSLTSENWALNMEICDMINESSDTARDAMKAIRKRLQQSAGKNNQVIMYTLTVLETCVKNCGKSLHVLVAQKDFIQDLIKLIGPKNDPSVAVQAKVLNLIQVWADAFKNQPDLNGVTQMYIELKNKGIEFPQTDLENAAPIYTPQRSVPEASLTTNQNINSTTIVPQISGLTLSPRQLTKLQSELEIVSINMTIFSEILKELKPGREDPEGYDLLNSLVATCKEMQSRVVDLIDRVTDDEITAELLRINDEMNNLFLRHQRFEKNRTNKSKINSPSEVLGAALGIASSNIDTKTSSTSTEHLKLLQQHNFDLNMLQNNFDKIDLNSASPPKTIRSADEFDILAKSRTSGSGSGVSNNNTDLLKDIPSLDALAGKVDSPVKRFDNDTSVPATANEIDEMEAWLGENIKSDIKDLIEETVTSSEFDKFLEERAAAADNLPSISTSTNNTILNDDNRNDSAKQDKSQTQNVDKNKLKKVDDLLLL